MKGQKGFTLIELMIALIIVSILVVVAVPAYSNYVKKSRRTDGKTALYSMQAAQEKYRGSNSTYGTLAQAYGGQSTSDSGYYTLAITVNTATGFTVTATAVTGSSQASDTEGGTDCSTLTLTVSGASVTETPTACW